MEYYGILFDIKTVYETREGCLTMSSLFIPATLTGAFIASLLKGSPSSWFRITSINVVIPFLQHQFLIHKYLSSFYN